MNDFDVRAKTWDENPIHMERSYAIATKMGTMIPIHNGMKALEFGAGTGILSFLLRDKLGTIVMMDNSAGMVEVMKEKVVFEKAVNFVPLCYNLENEMYNDFFDLIFNQMGFTPYSRCTLPFRKVLPNDFTRRVSGHCRSLHRRRDFSWPWFRCPQWV